ncbi:MAG: hypothetical protein AB7O96_08030 [Pseudobdellovibrionaceae bacterium]
MKSLFMALTIMAGTFASAETIEIPTDLFSDEKLLETLLDLKRHTYSASKIENHSLSSIEGVSIQIYHMTPLADGYAECSLMTRVEDFAPAGQRVQILKNECPRPL